MEVDVGVRLQRLEAQVGDLQQRLEVVCERKKEDPGADVHARLQSLEDTMKTEKNMAAGRLQALEGFQTNVGSMVSNLLQQVERGLASLEESAAHQAQHTEQTLQGLARKVEESLRSSATEIGDAALEAVLRQVGQVQGKSTFDLPPAGAGKVPESFLPRNVLREVSMVHEEMTPHNRAQSTIALITVLRYLMAELSQVMDVADVVARTREGTMEQSDLDGDNGEDQANLMQHYVNRFVASEGRDTPQMRWARALDSVDAEEGGTVDDEWLAQWTTEIAAGVPGFSLPSTLVPVESQESGRGRSAIMEEEHDFNKLLQDEEEEREWQAQRAREEEQERARLRQYESMGELEAAHLREEAGDFRAWEDGQLEAAMCREDRPGKRRCIISMEATSGSADAPRVTHRLQFEVPDDGTVVTISLRAHMAASAESTSTVPVAPTQNQALASGTALLEDSVVVHRDTVPDLLPYLTFQEYEAIYRSWRKQEQTLQQIEAKYGEEVADFLQAQRAVEQAEDVETEMRLPRTTRMEEIGKEHVQGRNPMCAPGSPLIRFPFFESMYGQWKGGLRTDQNVLEEFGSIWLGLFRAWKQWGLDAVRPALELELNMSTMDEGESAQGRCIPERSPISLPLRIPFSVVRQVFCRWRCEELQDEQVVERFGEVWLVVFQLMAEQGMSNAVHEVLSGLVDWDVTELEGSVDVAGPNGVVSGTGGVVESMTAATHTGTLNGSVSSVDVMPTQIEERVAVEEGLEQDDGEQGCIDRELKTHREVVLAAVQKKGEYLKHAPKKLKGDRHIVLAAVKQNGDALEFAAPKLKKDREIVLAAVQERGPALRFAAEKLKEDRSIVLAAVTQNGNALLFAAKKLHKDHSIWRVANRSESEKANALAAVQSDGKALQHTKRELRRNHDIVFAAVSHCGLALEFASEDLKRDRSIVLAADGHALHFAAKELLADRDIVLTAVKQKGIALQHARSEQKCDRGIVWAACRQDQLGP
eukprot:s6145_g3.t1